MMGQNVGYPDCDVLILIPSRLEREQLRKIWKDDRLVQSGLTIQIAECGFGVIAAAANAVRWIARYRPSQVVLLGIAGSYRDELPAGTAYCFDQVACDGIGVGRGSQFIPAGDLGWQQWPGNREETAIGDILDLRSPSALPDARSNSDGNSVQHPDNRNPDDRAEPAGLVSTSPGLLLTVTSAAAGADDLSWRQQRYPTAVAEEMEGFAVALACRLEKVPLTIIRGISNRAGDRDKANWRIAEALEGAADLCCQTIQSAQQRK